MAMGPEIGSAHVSVGADTQKLDEGLAKAQQQTKRAADSMAASMSRLENATKRANAAMLQAQAANKRAAASMLQAQTAAMRAASATERNTAAVKRHSGGIQALSRQFLVLRAAMAGVAGVLGLRAIATSADAWANLTAKLNQVTTSAGQTAAVQEQLFRIAQRTGTELESVGNLYFKLSNASSELGMSQQQVMQFTDSMNKMFVTSGVSAVNASQAIHQLTQAFTSQVLRGDELRTMHEAFPALIRTVAAAQGQSAQELITTAKEEGIAIQDVIEAVLKIRAEVDRQFALMPVTIERAMQQVSNAFTKAVGITSTASGSFKNVTDALQSLADTVNSPDFRTGLGLLLQLLAALATQSAGAVAGLAAFSRQLEGLEERLVTLGLPKEWLDNIKSGVKVMSSSKLGLLGAALEDAYQDWQHLTGAINQTEDASETLQQKWDNLRTFGLSPELIGQLEAVGVSMAQLGEVIDEDQRKLDRLLGEVGGGARKPEEGATELPPGVDPAAADRANDAADAVQNLKDKMSDLRTEMQITAVGPTTEMGVQMKALAEAAQTLDMSIEELNAAPAPLRALAVEYANLATQAHFAAQEQEAIQGLEEHLAELRLQMRGEEGGEELARQLEHLSAAASAAGMSIAELAQASPEVRNRAQAYVEEAVALDRVIARNEALKEAEALRAELDPGEQIRVSLEETAKKIQEFNEAGVLKPAEADTMQAKAVQDQVDAVTGSLDEQAATKAKIRDTQAQINELVRQQAISEEEGARLTALNQEDPERRGRIESGSRLPDEIDAANIAASGLASTLTDLENLSLESLAQSFQDIAAQIAQAVIQALIFKAIMAGVGGAAPTPTPVPGAGAGGGASPATGLTPMISRSAHGNVFMGGHLKRMARGGFITKRPMIMPMATGGALIGEAGPEAVMPLKRMASGNLGVASEGGGGGAQQINNVYANNIEPGTVSTLYNLANRAAPGAVVNARSRGLVRERKKPPF